MYTMDLHMPPSPLSPSPPHTHTYSQGTDGAPGQRGEPGIPGRRGQPGETVRIYLCVFDGIPGSTAVLL